MKNEKFEKMVELFLKGLPLFIIIPLNIANIAFFVN